MGPLDDEPGRQDDELRHPITISRPYALLDRELTFAEMIAFDPQYAKFMTQFNAKPEDAAFGPMWYDAVQFCHWLSGQAGLSEVDQAYQATESLDEDKYPREQDVQASWAVRNWPIRLDRRGFRLPTEAEWEAACRAGTRTMYAQGGDVELLRNYAWTMENSGGRVHSPKTLRPGRNGLFDMQGNVFEWCHDWYEVLENSANVVDPLGPEVGSARTSRSGGWSHSADLCRSSNRGRDHPTLRNGSFGFRLALTLSGFSTETEPGAEEPQTDLP